MNRFYEALKRPSVLVWKPSHYGCGHAAVFLRHHYDEPVMSQDIKGYASWWPGRDDPDSKTCFGTHMVSSNKSNFFMDTNRESPTRLQHRLPEHVIHLPELDREKMLAEWASIRDKPSSHYRIMRKNCSTVAARVIRAGMTTSWWELKLKKKAHQPWWTPYDVLKLAKALS